MKVELIVVNGGELTSQYVGETESKVNSVELESEFEFIPQLRNVFEEAQKIAPSIVFLDEIDAMCPKRDEVYSDLIS